jgi:hypothetical protein
MDDPVQAILRVNGSEFALLLLGLSFLVADAKLTPSDTHAQDVAVRSNALIDKILQTYQLPVEI